jgi:hypothetical protein
LAFAVLKVTVSPANSPAREAPAAFKVAAVVVS